MLPSSVTFAQTQPRGQPDMNQPGARVYRPAPQSSQPTQGRAERSRVPGGYRVAPDGRGYYPPAVYPNRRPPHLSPVRPSWYQHYWSHPNDWWHPHGWFGNTNIWWRDGWWFETALIGPTVWEWAYDDAGMSYGYGQPPPAITCEYRDPYSGRVVELTIIGYFCPAPIDVQIPDDDSGGY